jgi:hypothetical protein
MRTVKPVRTAEAATKTAPRPADAAHITQDAPEAEEAAMAELTAEGHESETYEMFRVGCPDCAQPIALLAEEETLPEHALCSSPWNPFGLTVCQGSGRPAADASPLDGAFGLQEHDVAALLTLPEGLDWRTQPFSHAGGPAALAPGAPARPRRG